VLQEVYLRVWRRAGRFDSGKGSAIAWLATIARNCAIDEMRRRPVPTSSGDELLDKIVDEGQPVDDRLCDREEQAAVQRCLEELQQDHRKSIRLAFFGGLTHSQLAERLNVPLGTLKSWIKRGLANLKVCLGYE
jgi:RNA polymerase sigma-70 factor (ECF subfamily)